MNFSKHTHRLLLISSLSFATLQLQAQKTNDIVELQPFEVKSYWFSHGNHQQNTHELSQSDLSVHHSTDLANVLQQTTPDIGIIRKAGTSNDIIMRGLSQDNLDVTIDGTKTFCACSNRMDPPISQVSSAMLQTIELTQGAFDLKKSGGFGGSIRVETKQPSAVESLQFTSTFGSFNQFTTSVFGTVGNDDLKSVAILEYTQSDPYKDGSGTKLTDFPKNSKWALDDYLETFKNDRAFQAIHGIAKVSHQLQNEQSLQLNYRFREDKNVLYPGLRMDADLTKSEELSVSYGSTDFKNKIRAFQMNLFVNQTDHDMVDSRRRSAAVNPMLKPRPQYVLERGYFMESLAESGAIGSQFTYKWDQGDIHWETGAEWTQRNWDINNRLGGGTPTSGPQSEIFNNMIPKTESSTVGAYCQNVIQFSNDVQFDLGVRLDSFQTEATDDLSFLESQLGPISDKKEWMPSAKFVFRKQATKSTALFAGIGTSVRVANGQERYIQLKRPGSMPNWLGNPNLKSPRNNEIAIGFSTNNDRYSVQAKAFYSQLRNFIYINTIKPSSENNFDKVTQSYTNIDAELFGWDLSGQFKLSESWAINSGISWQRGQKSQFMKEDRSKNLAEIPPLKGMTSLRYLSSKYDLSLESQYADSQSRIDTTLGEIELPSYILINFRARMSVNKHTTLSFGIENLFDTTYAVHNAMVRNPFSTYTVVNEPGRSFYVSIEMSW